MGCGRNDFESTSSHTGRGHHHHKGCVCEVVKTILEIQNQAVEDECDSCGTSCFLEPLGGLMHPAKKHVDTRVFMLLNANGHPFFAYYTTPSGAVYPSYFFRVEDMFDCCATLRVVAPWDGESYVDLTNSEENGASMALMSEVCDFKKTESCLTVDLNFFAGIQCIKDVNLHICD